MIGGLFSKGGGGHSVRTVGSVHKGRSVGSSNGYVCGVGHSLPSTSGGMKLNSKIEGKINELQDRFNNTKADY